MARNLAVPLWILALVVATAAVHVGGELLAPVALALYLAILLNPIVEWLHRRRVPRVVSALLLLGMLAAVGTGLVETTWQPARQWIDRAPETLKTIENRIRPLRATIARFDVATAHVATIAEGTATAVVAQPAGPSLSTRLLLAVPRALIIGFSVVAFSAFLLIFGTPALHHLSASQRTSARRAGLIQAFESATAAIGRYFATVALINAGLGVCTALLAQAVGLPNAVLWGSLAAALNFIPYIGPAAMFALLTIVALVSFPTTGPVLATCLGFLTLTTLEGQVVQPILVGRQMELSPLLVFAAVWFGGWLWGVAGVVLAVPTLVALKAALPDGSEPQADPADVETPMRWRIRHARP